MAEPKEIEKKGMGKDKGSRKFENTSAADRKKANADGKFGYFDEANKRYVPAFIDAIDGGGRDARGDEFAGGPLSQILNNIGISPYGSQRERPFGGPTTSPIQQAVANGPARPMISPTQTMPDELSGVPFNNTPPVMPDEVSGVPFNNTPNPFAGPTYDMPMSRPVEPLGVTTQEMALADIEARKAAHEAAYPSDRERRSFGMEKLLVGGSRGLGDITDHLGRFSDSTQDRMYSSLMPPAPETMQYSGMGTASGNAEFDAFMNMVRNTPGQGGLANNPELAFSIFQRMKAAGNLPSVMMYQ